MHLLGRSSEVHLKTHSGEKSNKCNECNYASSQAGDLRKHLEKHSGEKSNKCNECKLALYWASNLGTHLKTNIREKFRRSLGSSKKSVRKRPQNFDTLQDHHFASSQAGHLRTHLKTHSGENSKNATINIATSSVAATSQFCCSSAISEVDTHLGSIPAGSGDSHQSQKNPLPAKTSLK